MADNESESLPFGCKVRVDGKGTGTITAASYIDNQVCYNVHIEGTGHHFQLPPSRLTVIPATVSTAAASPDIVHVPPVEQTTEPSLSNIASGKENVPNRFTDVSDADIQGIITKQTNRNTLSKTFYDLKLLKAFLSQPAINENREIQDIPPTELCNILCKFLISVRKPDGRNYEPSSLRGFVSSFDRQLRRNNYGHSLVSDPKFAKLREVLKSKQKELKSEGKGNQPNKTDAISDEDVEVFWNADQFGTKTPDTVINTLWFFNTVHFGLRGAHEHRAMQWGDIELKTDDDEHEYLQWTERQTKTRPGDNPRDMRTVKPKMWANLENPSRCPVEIYKFYASKRPAEYCNADDPFYIATSTLKQIATPWHQWFKRQPIGPNKLTSIVRRMVSESGLQTDRKLSNHSGRKYLLQKLTDSNIPANHIMQISGHRNIQSVNNYSHLNSRQHKNISHILSKPTPVGDGNNPSISEPLPSTSHVSQPYRPLAPKLPTTCEPREPATVSTPCDDPTPMFGTSNSMNSQRQSNSVCTVYGGLNTLFSGNMYGGNVHVNIYPQQDDSNTRSVSNPSTD